MKIIKFHSGKDRRTSVNIFLLLCLVNILHLPLVSCQNDDDAVKDVVFDECIVIVPDIQYYTNNPERFAYLDHIVNYCKENQNKISFCLQTGDLTENNDIWQWENSYLYFFSKLPKDLSCIYCLGNHDYGYMGSSDTRSSKIPEKIYSSRNVSIVGATYDNYVKFENIGNSKFAIMVLEFAPRNEVLGWANKVIQDNSDTPFIILTHAFLNNQGKLFDFKDPNCDNMYSQKSYSMGGDYLNDSREIFDKIIFGNHNVKMVVCGHCLHNDFIATEFVKNQTGDDIPCIMVNYQHDAEGGKGNIGILALKDSTFHLYSYSTVEKRFLRYYTSFKVK